MAELTPQQLARLEETHDSVVELTALIKGGNGSVCIIGTLEEIKRNLSGFCELNSAEHEKIKDEAKHLDSRIHLGERRFWALVALLTGSGVINAAALIKLLA